MQIKLLQWNILFKEDIENIVKTIQEINPDIVSLQELTIKAKYNPTIPNTPEHIAKMLDYEYYFQVAHRWENDPELAAIGNGIFTRFPIEKSSFSQVREEPMANIAGSDEGRVYVESVIKVGEKSLTVGNVHLSFTDHFEEDGAKKKETDSLIEIIKQKQKDFIFSGDLNSIPDSYTINQVNKYLVNCGPSFDQHTWTTRPLTEPTFGEGRLAWRLDYIFATKDVRVQDASILEVEYSDHLPILATFTV